MIRKSTKKPSTSRADHAWDALQQLIDLAAAAQIPLIGGGFDVTSKILTTLKDARATQTKCRDLLDIVSEYTTAIWKFVELVSADRLKEARDPESAFAREVIEEFGRALDNVVNTVQGLKGKKFLTRFATTASVNREIAHCKDQLARAYDSFKRAQQSITVAHTFQLRDAVDEGILTVAAQNDPYKILGAKSLRHDSITIRGRPRHWKNLKGFWEDIYEADLDRRPTLVKVYKEAKGGKHAFEKDLRWLSENYSSTFWSPRARAYCWDSHAPFIVLDAICVDPLEDWMRGEIAKLVPSDITAINRFLNSLKARFESAIEALDFLLTTDLSTSGGTGLSIVIDSQHSSGQPRLMLTPEADPNGGAGLTNAYFEKHMERFCLMKEKNTELSPWELTLLDDYQEEKTRYIPMFKISDSVLGDLNDKLEEGGWSSLKHPDNWYWTTSTVLRASDAQRVKPGEYSNEYEDQGLLLALPSEAQDPSTFDVNLNSPSYAQTSLPMLKAAIYGVDSPIQVSSKLALIPLKPTNPGLANMEGYIPMQTIHSTNGVMSVQMNPRAFL